VLSEGKGPVEFLARQEGLFRVYSPSYSLPQHTAASAGLQLADGIDPLILQTYARFMDEATGVPRKGYSVTLPPLEGDDVHLTNRSYQPDAILLGYLNVRFLAAEFPLDIDGLSLKEKFETTWIYENERAFPRAWVQKDEHMDREDIQDALITRYQPNQIELTARGPGMLVLSEILYPGWQVYVNGTRAQIKPVMNLLRGVELIETENHVTFLFRPLWLYVGIASAAVGLFLVLISFRKVPFVA